MTRWPRCRRVRAGSSISWCIRTADLCGPLMKDLPKSRTRTRSNSMIRFPDLTRRCLGAALLVLGIDFAAMPVQAQLAPSQPIKIVVGVPAGGLGDLAARILAQRLSENGHPAIVENRVGGNGIIATDAVAKSRAAGYTLIMGNHSTLAILPHITKIGYDPEKDLAPIALMLAAPNVAIVRSALPVTSMRDLVAYGKANRLTNATQGIGASGHLIGETRRYDVRRGRAHAGTRAVRTSAGAGGVVTTA